VTGESAGVRSLRGLTRSDVDRVGALAADLGELVVAGLRVPPGFGIDAGAFPDADGVSGDLRARIATAYSGLGIGPTGRPVSVTVRPSVLEPDAAVRSVRGCAGYTTVRGHDELVRAIEACRDAAPSPVAVVVQVRVAAQQAGMVHTGDPATGEDLIVVEAALGQGEVGLTGAVEPDVYVFRTPGIVPVSVRVGRQAQQVVRGREGHDLRTTLDPWTAADRVLDDDQAAAVARAARRVRGHFGQAQDVEWAMAAGRLWLLATRPSHPAEPDVQPVGRSTRAGV